MDGGMIGMSLAVALSAATAGPTPSPGNWCTVGQKVIIPDGREGPVTSVSGDICRVLVFGEKYVSLWAYYIIEPAYQKYGR